MSLDWDGVSSQVIMERSSAIIQTPSYKERVFFLGANGSGKTELASRMITAYPRAYILDVKYDFPISWPNGTYRVIDTPPGIGWFSWFRGWGSKRVIYRPKPPYDSGPWITYWLDWLFRKARKEGKVKPFIVDLDEGAWAAYNGAKAAMSRLAIAGRSIGIGLWITSQRPRGITVETRSEAWRWYVFYLRSRDDRKEVVDYLDKQISEEQLSSTTENYQFWEIRRGEGGRMNYRLMPPIRLVPEVSA